MTEIDKKYIKMTQIEHILKRPGMYIGGIETIENQNWIYENNKMIKQTISYSPGLFKLFDELIVNAYDQTVRDQTVRNIKVWINANKNEITVFNDGIGIDVVIHPTENIYVPELIFSHLLASTSFDENAVKTTGGIHGLGAKLTAIFSSKFTVEVGDPVNKKSFHQTYKNNLSEKSKPIIKPYNKNIGYVKISYVPDLKYFNLDSLNQGIIGLMERRVYDISAITRQNVRVSLNDELIEIKDINGYVSMFTDKKQIEIKCDEDIKHRWKIIVTQSNGEFEQISFVNGINTIKGGTHVEYITNQIVKKIKNHVQKKFKTDKIKDKFIKNNIWIFISSEIEDPSFSSQIKDELMTSVTKFGSMCLVTDKSVKKIYESEGFDDLIKNHINATQDMEIKKISVKRKSLIQGIPKLHDANYAGTNKSLQCKLILTEGDSAKTMAISGLSVIPKSNNYYGIFPLKGKLINVRDIDHNRIIKNNEFVNLKNILGLQMGKTYTKDNINELRYGSVILMMDADVDGSHIKGLFINMIHYYWPSLLKINGWIKFFVTPIVKTTNKSKVNIFYNNDDYNSWKNTNKIENWKIKYYKGLGTNTTTEAKEYFNNLDNHIIDLTWEQNSMASIELGFSKDKAEERKAWLKKYDSGNWIDPTNKILTYNDFINKELIHFSNYDNIRSIPNVMDGLKPSQRKILYAAFKRDLKTSEMKVAQFSGYVGEHTSYHHGESSLTSTIIGMAQTFVGSNNINLLHPGGQFGSRLLGGKDHASARYIFTKLGILTRLIFRKEDDGILEYLDDDGLLIEPKFYVPIIPMILINGSEGIGTGYSTNIPKFNPLDIINAIKSKINNKPVKNIVPWSHGFKGQIIKIDENQYITKGKYTVEKNKVVITELPLGTWTEKHREHLTDVVNESDMIKDVKHNSTHTKIDITVVFENETMIEELENQKEKSINKLEKLLSLVSTINLSNMHAYNDNLEIRKFKLANEIIDSHYKVRLEFYEKRKVSLMESLETELRILDSKAKFMELLIKGELKIIGTPRDQIIKKLIRKELYQIPNQEPYDYLLKMHLISVTYEKINDLLELYKIKKENYAVLKNKTIKQMWEEDLKQLEEAWIHHYEV